MTTTTLTYGEMRSRAEQIYDQQVKDGVLNGLAALQAEHGDKWVEQIDCSTLDLRSSASCVLGQLYGDFEEGAIAMCGYDEHYDWAKRHGFFASNGADNWDALDDAWREVLCDGPR